MVNRLERAVERIVEGTIARAFRLRVQPAEIGRQLERAMLDGRVSSVGATLAPNLYDVRLHPDDATMFVGWEDALGRELEGWLAQVAFRRGIATLGPIHVSLAADSAVSRRSVRIAARFGGGESGDDSLPGDPVRMSTIRLVPDDPTDPIITLAGRAITVGRAAANDVVLPRPEVSRHHARLERAGTGWRAVDLDSTNGTWVNGERASRRPLAPGDEVAFGSARFTVVAG